MKMLVGIAFASALLLVPAAALAQERFENTLLGGVAGAVVGGPIGAIAGGAIGYTAGHRIARGLGFRHHHHYYRHYYRARHVRHTRRLHQNYAAR